MMQDAKAFVDELEIVFEERPISDKGHLF